MAREPFNPDLIQVPPEERAPSGRAGDRPPAEASYVSVSQVTSLVAKAIELALPPTLYVVGEVSNFKRHSSGHLYFTLKDAHSELSCAMWRSQAARLKFKPADGMEVIATGGVEVFERAGRYQLYVRKLEPRGVGSLELAFRQLCEKLSAEGLFDPEHKKPLPAYPSRIVVVTSPTGAAVVDILRTIERRFPCVHLMVYPVPVQGEGAAQRIAYAIRKTNQQAAQLGGVDLLIVGRGGGSLEDLWAFNEEVVARAIHASRLPVISAVGHEVDVTIADLVADVRAATPTAAGELAVPVLAEVIEDLDEQRARLDRAMGSLRDLALARFRGLLQRGALREPLAMVQRRERIVDELSSRVHRGFGERLRESRERLDGLESVVRRIAPHAYLMRVSTRLGEVGHRLDRSLARRLAASARSCDDVLWRMERYGPPARMPRHSDRLNRAGEALRTSLGHRLVMAGEQVRREAQRLSAMGYESVLRRGFSITRTKKGRCVVRSTAELKDRVRVVTQLADGEFEAEVVNLNQLELFE